MRRVEFRITAKVPQRSLEPLGETLRAKGQGRAPQASVIETGAGGAGDGRGEALRAVVSGVSIQGSVFAVANDVPRPSAPERDDRRSAGERLDRRDSEVFFTRLNVHRAGSIEVAELLGGAARHELYGRGGGDVAETLLLRAAPDEDEAAAQPPRGFDRDVVALVRHERADGQEKVAARPVAPLKVFDVHRRVADLRLASVVAEDPRRDRRRIGQVASRPPGRGHVPRAQPSDGGGLESTEARPSRWKVEIE